MGRYSRKNHRTDYKDPVPRSSHANVPQPLTRQLRRAMLRREVWLRWAWVLKENDMGQLTVNIPTDDLGPMPRRIRRSIARLQFRKMERDARAAAQRLRASGPRVEGE